MSAVATSRGRVVGWLSWSWWWSARSPTARSTTAGRARRATAPATWPRRSPARSATGQSVADSDSEASKAIRERIDAQIEAGASDAQIRDELAAAYGERVLLTPGRSGVSSLVWTLPVVAVVVAFAGLAVRLPSLAG